MPHVASTTLNGIYCFYLSLLLFVKLQAATETKKKLMEL